MVADGAIELSYEGVLRTVWKKYSASLNGGRRRRLPNSGLVKVLWMNEDHLGNEETARQEQTLAMGRGAPLGNGVGVCRRGAICSGAYLSDDLQLSVLIRLKLEFSNMRR